MRMTHVLFRVRGGMDHARAISPGIARPKAVFARSDQLGMVFVFRIDAPPFRHLSDVLRISVDRPGGAVAMRLACLAAFLHVSQNIEIQLGIVMQNCLPRRHCIAEVLRNKDWIGKKARQPSRYLQQSVSKRLRFENCASIGAKIIECVIHRDLICCLRVACSFQPQSLATRKSTPFSKSIAMWLVPPISSSYIRCSKLVKELEIEKRH
jgi:hypothetical protein